ncbi:thiosulfate/3-mercaptopyruvate sulfurtransferase [Amphritea atlantica]|uniref:Sulfurtransferase n=1 Tax=Amphritea atlantica TaxID=355243 RepID=A0A1H9L236_9GAMM|nr:sulfurtransferase [Amphritea atlantica]SER05197.1 thiosulfate/3-mercaptopyruvate sulfurtransferase [Amphritea atlantica]
MSLPLVISPQQLSEQLSTANLLILDLSSAENYHKGHIPGAIHMDPARLLRGHGEVPNKIPEPEQLSRLLGEIGLTPERHVVVYDDQMGPWAGRMIWTLNSIGHQRCSFVNGHLVGWIEAGLPLETQINTPTPTLYPVTLTSEYLADIAYIYDHLDASDHIVLDVRSPAEFTGEKIINAKRGGHIPGAVNYEWTRALVSSEQPQLRPAAEIMAELNALGVTPDKTIITHCQTHRRSGLSYLFTKHLGFDKVRCYDGSWFEWGNRDDTPIET